jgi:prevent-host-death family protein
MNTISSAEATSRLNELIAAAGAGEPQIITSNGAETTVLISYEEYRRLKARQKSLVEFLRDSPLSGSEIELERSKAEAGRASLSFVETE